MLAAIDCRIVISCSPRTSPTFQSRLGLSGCELWQATHASPISTGVTMRIWRSKIEPEMS